MLLLALLAIQDEEELRPHISVHKKIAPAVVGVRSPSSRGTGMILDKEGWILTSLASVGLNGENVEVYLKGHKRVNGRVVERRKDLEMAVVKIDAKDVTGVAALGDSERARPGSVCYVLGDSFNSIFTDDQVAISTGYVSARYDLKSAKAVEEYFKRE